MGLGAGRRRDDVSHLLMLDRGRKNKVKCENGRVDFRQCGFVERAGIKGKEYAAFPAMAE
jgi:hypothetical protein